MNISVTSSFMGNAVFGQQPAQAPSAKATVIDWSAGAILWLASAALSLAPRDACGKQRKWGNYGRTIGRNRCEARTASAGVTVGIGNPQ